MVHIRIDSEVVSCVIHSVSAGYQTERNIVIKTLVSVP